MARKFSDISLTDKIGLIELIESKKSKFRARVSSSQQNLADVFDSNMEFLLTPQIRNIDNVTKDIFELIKNNPGTEMSGSIEALWNDTSLKYGGLYGSIENFNESYPGVDNIIASTEWTNFFQSIQGQFHEYDNYGSRFS